MQGFECRHSVRQQPDAARDGSALKMHVRPETADSFAAETQVYRFTALQLLLLRLGHQRQQQISRAFGGERRSGRMRELASDAQCDRNVGDQQEVGCAQPRCMSENRIERRGIGRGVRPGFRAGIPRSRRRAIEFRDNLRELVFVARHALSV